MPTVLRSGPYRFFFYSLENNEPPHIHVERDDKVAKYWLASAELASSEGFRAHELRKLQMLIAEHLRLFEEAWHEHFAG